MGEKLKKQEDISEELVNKLTHPDDLPDDAKMIPVDMRGTGGDFEDVEGMIEQLGNKGTAEAFVKALEYFEKNSDKIPEEDRPHPMTAGEWKAILENDIDEGEEEEFFEEPEEGAFQEGSGEEEDAEPAAKKAKTD